MGDGTSSTAEATELLPGPIPSGALDALVHALNTLGRNTTLQFALEVGRLILDACYGADLEAWRRRGDRDASFRALRQRDDLELDKVLVSRSVRLYELEQRLSVSALTQLSATHFYAVLGLPDKQQERLLTSANDKGWTTRRLEDEAKKVRKKSGERRGRPPIPSFQRSVRQLSRVVEKREAFFGDLEQLEDMSEAELGELRSQISGIRAACDELQAKLNERLSESTEPEGF